MKRKAPRIKAIQVQTGGIFPELSKMDYISKKEFSTALKKKVFYYIESIRLAYSIGINHEMEYELKPEKNCWKVYRNTINLGSFTTTKGRGLMESFESKFL